MLTFDFLQMDPSEAAEAASGMLRVLSQSQRIHVTTALGTDLTFGKRGRQPGLFNGMADTSGKVGSSSFESTSASRKPKPTGTLWWTPRSAISVFHPPPLP